MIIQGSSKKQMTFYQILSLDRFVCGICPFHEYGYSQTLDLSGIKNRDNQGLVQQTSMYLDKYMQVVLYSGADIISPTQFKTMCTTGSGNFLRIIHIHNKILESLKVV